MCRPPGAQRGILHRRRAAQPPAHVPSAGSIAASVRPARHGRRTARAATTSRRATARAPCACRRAATNSAPLSRTSSRPDSVVGAGVGAGAGAVNTLRTRCSIARAGPVSRAENMTAASPHATATHTSASRGRRRTGRCAASTVRRARSRAATASGTSASRSARSSSFIAPPTRRRGRRARGAGGSSRSRAGGRASSRSRPACSRAGAGGRPPRGAPGPSAASAATTSSPRPPSSSSAGRVRHGARLRPQRAGPRPVDRAVDHDPVQPRAERPAAVEAVQRAQRRQERLLGDVLGGRRVVHDEPGRPVGRGPVAAEELVDRVRRPGLGGADERRLSPAAQRSSHAQPARDGVLHGANPTLARSGRSRPSARRPPPTRRRARSRPRARRPGTRPGSRGSPVPHGGGRRTPAAHARTPSRPARAAASRTRRITVPSRFASRYSTRGRATPRCTRKARTDHPGGTRIESAVPENAVRHPAGGGGGGTRSTTSESSSASTSSRRSPDHRGPTPTGRDPAPANPARPRDRGTRTAGRARAGSAPAARGGARDRAARCHAVANRPSPPSAPDARDRAPDGPGQRSAGGSGKELPAHRQRPRQSGEERELDEVHTPSTVDVSQEVPKRTSGLDPMCRYRLRGDTLLHVPARAGPDPPRAR